MLRPEASCTERDLHDGPELTPAVPVGEPRGVGRSVRGLSLLAGALVTFIGSAPAAAQEQPVSERPGFRPMRYDEDWRPLADPDKRTEPLDALKHIAVGEKGWLTLGGEARLRGEAYDRLDLGFGGAGQDEYLLGRAMLHADLHLDESVRGFVQLRYGAVRDERRPLGPVQDNDVDVNQAFVDLSTSVSGGRATLRAGRQELLFGSGRMVAPREGPNVRLSFDGVRAFWSAPRGPRVDVFYTRPVLPRSGAFDDRSSRTYEFWGAYGTTPVRAVPGAGLDLYYFGLDRSRVAFAQGIAAETRHTVGGRWFGRSGAWDWDFEAAYQFGDFGRRGIRAFTLANDLGHTWRDLPWSPRLGLRLDLASGDGDLSDGRLGTFEVPFPKLPYLTEAGFIGPANIMDVHPSFTVQPRPDLRLGVEYAAVWKHREADAFYLPPLRPVPGTAGQGRFATHLVQVSAYWSPTPQVSLEALYTRALVGDALARSGARDSDFLLLQATTRF